jgi:hypothetical protein
MKEIRKFVDAVFKLFPEEAPMMAAMAAARRMGFGETHLDYGSIENDKY